MLEIIQVFVIDLLMFFELSVEFWFLKGELIDIFWQRNIYLQREKLMMNNKLLPLLLFQRPENCPSLTSSFFNCTVFPLHINVQITADFREYAAKHLNVKISEFPFVTFFQIFQRPTFTSTFSSRLEWAFPARFRMDQSKFVNLHDFKQFLHLATAVFVKDIGTFTQLKESCEKWTANHSAEALMFVDDITTMLDGGEIRTVCIEYMLSLLTFTNDVFFYAGKNKTILFALVHRLAGKTKTILFTFK